MARAPLIFLIGYRGTGKSTVARLVAEQLHWSWVDADEVLETRFRQTIRQVFEQEGETGFRIKEANILAELCQGREQVVATGGGVVLRPENRQRLRGGHVAWLTADSATLWDRLQRDPTNAERRPPLSAGGLAEVEALLHLREPLYRACADLVVNTTGRSPDDIARDIINSWNHA